MTEAQIDWVLTLVTIVVILIVWKWLLDGD
jgi:hypothetical protein